MRRLPIMCLRAMVIAVATWWLSSIATAGQAEPLEQLPAGVQVLRLDVYPASISLQHRFDDAQMLVFGELTTGERIDVTRMVTVHQTPELVNISQHGHVLRGTLGYR